jgi:outer membrane protein OmpA-like peptidoglycan-associated protein
MSRSPDQVLSRRGLAVLLGSAVGCVLVAPGLGGVARSEDSNVDVETIERALKGRRTRGPAAEEPAAPRPAIERLKAIRRQRGLSRVEREELAELTRNSPQIDLTVYFAFDSDGIEAQAAATLARLAQALSNPDLRGRGFGIFGHTDAAGTAQYNQALSERRAEAVRHHLITTFAINPDSLLAVGFGFERLKNPDNPRADENRRVQIVNLER